MNAPEPHKHPSIKRYLKRALIVRCLLFPLLGMILYSFLIIFRLGPQLDARGLGANSVGLIQLEAMLWGLVGFFTIGPLVGWLCTRRDIERSRWNAYWEKALHEWRPGEVTAPAGSATPTPTPGEVDNPEPSYLQQRFSPPENVEAIDDELNRLLETLTARADRTVQKLERRLTGMRTMISRVEEAVVISTPEGDLEFLNEAAQRLYDLQPLPQKRKKRRKQNRRLQNEIRDEQVAMAVEQVRATGEAAETTYRQASDLGRMIHLRVFPMPQPSRDLVLIFRDITKQHQLENMRREFVANVGHELRTPLAAIKGYIETLFEEGLDDPKTTEHFLRIVERNATRLEALIADLLELSRLDAQDNRKPDTERLDFAEVIPRPIELVLPRAREKEIDIVNRVPAGLPMVLARRRPLEQVVLNLLANAIQYSEPQTVVTIDANIEQDFLAIRFIDQGLGIAPEHHERIFERFYRVDRDRSRAAGGTGLGLSIVKHIVQQFGGSIRVESARGKGATFIVRLPLADMLV